MINPSNPQSQKFIIYLNTVIETLEKITKTLNEKLAELIILEQKRLSLQVALLEQTIAQTKEFKSASQKIAQLDDKMTAMRNPNGYCHQAVVPAMHMNEYYYELYSNYEWLKDHGHMINVKGAENAYYRHYAPLTWDYLNLPADCSSLPQHLGVV